MTLEDTLGLGKTLVEVIQRANGNIEQYRNKLEAELHRDNRREMSHITMEQLKTELNYVERLHRMEENIKAKFTVSEKRLILTPYVSDDTQRIPVYRPGSD